MARTFETIRDKIVTKLQGLSDIEEVNTDPTMNFAGFPAVAVYPSNQESDYQMTNQNERTYAFICAVFYETKRTGIATALIAMYDLVDQILDTFDQDQTLTGIQTDLPAGKQIINVEPVPSEWGQVEDREMIMTNVVLQVRITADLS